MSGYDYDRLMQDSIRDVVRKVLKDVAENGLPGKNHFYITFCTHFPGVRVPEHLLDEYPEELTIVIQHQFWDLMIDDEGFSIVLSFNGRQEALYVPFNSLVEFNDPSEEFVLELEPTFPADEEDNNKPIITQDDEHENVIIIDFFRKK